MIPKPYYAENSPYRKGVPVQVPPVMEPVLDAIKNAKGGHVEVRLHDRVIIIHMSNSRMKRVGVTGTLYKWCQVHIDRWPPAPRTRKPTKKGKKRKATKTSKPTNRRRRKL